MLLLFIFWFGKTNLLGIIGGVSPSLELDANMKLLVLQDSWNCLFFIPFAYLWDVKRSLDTVFVFGNSISAIRVRKNSSKKEKFLEEFHIFLHAL